eukprot:Nk52_evm11s158 gene=Nk52_evmTU11s158
MSDVMVLSSGEEEEEGELSEDYSPSEEEEEEEWGVSSAKTKKKTMAKVSGSSRAKRTSPANSKGTARGRKKKAVISEEEEEEESDYYSPSESEEEEDWEETRKGAGSRKTAVSSVKKKKKTPVKAQKVEEKKQEVINLDDEEESDDLPSISELTNEKKTGSILSLSTTESNVDLTFLDNEDAEAETDEKGGEGEKKKKSKGAIPKGGRETRDKMASRLPLVLGTIKHHPTILMETENENLDMSGDIGAVGRFGCDLRNGVTLDLKGYIYKGDVCACNSFMVVGIGTTEAKVESVIDSYFNVTCKGGALDTEDVVEGTLNEDDWSIASDANVVTNLADGDGGGSNVKFKHSEDLAKNTQTSRVVNKKSKRKTTGKSSNAKKRARN